MPVDVDPRFQRNLGVVSLDTMERFARTHVLVAGVGGAGGQAAVDLSRLGFGFLTLADFDVYEIHNANRQIGCFESTLGKKKVDVVARMCRDVNPKIRVREVHEGITAGNCERLLDGGELPPPEFVIEVIDVAGVPAKRDLHAACRKKGVVAMTGIMIGFGAALHVFPPGAPAYDPALLTPEGKLRWDLLVPAIGNYTVKEHVDACLAGRGHAPTCVIGATTASALMVSEIVRGVLRGKDAMIAFPDYVYVDYLDGRYVRGRLS